VPPGASRYDSRIVVPVWALIVVAWNLPEASTFATIGVSLPNDGAAAVRAQATAGATNLTFILCSFPSPLVGRRRVRGGRFSLSWRRLSAPGCGNPALAAEFAAAPESYVLMGSTAGDRNQRRERR